MFALVVGTLLSLLVPLIAFYFSSCAETQGPFEQTGAATIVGFRQVASCSRHDGDRSENRARASAMVPYMVRVAL